MFYVTIHEVFKEGSVTTPMRLVTNSSLRYKGRCLNDVLMKGPNTLNNIFDVQLRFRCYGVAIVCDMSKMYHSIHTTPIERHLRRVLHRDLDPSKKVRTYGIERANFGDRPCATIAGTAVRKTAETFEDINPEASKKIIEDSYVDDITTGTEDHRAAETLKTGIQEILKRGGFKIKGFITSGDKSSQHLLPSGGMESVLGVWWNPEEDVFRVKVRINLSRKERQARTSKDLDIEEIPTILEIMVTRRLLLSITNSCNDVYGSLGPITVSLKIGMRKINGREWDEELQSEIKEEWVKILTKLKQAEQVSFRRCVRPDNAVGSPSLVVCNDGSEVAMCTTSHIRWICEDGSIQCRLWASKTRVTPLKKMTMPNIELMSAMMAVRLARSIRKSSIWQFENIYHVTDSKCMLATLSKETSALGEFVGNRVTEILDTTEINQWYHIKIQYC